MTSMMIMHWTHIGNAPNSDHAECHLAVTLLQWSALHARAHGGGAHGRSHVHEPASARAAAARARGRARWRAHRDPHGAGRALGAAIWAWARPQGAGDAWLGGPRDAVGPARA